LDLVVAARFAAFPLIAYHIPRSIAVHAAPARVSYASPAAISRIGSAVFACLSDRPAIGMLVSLTLVAAAYTRLALLDGFWSSLVGVCLWAVGMGVRESIIPTAVSTFVPPPRRASAGALSTGVYGIAWFPGIAVLGAILDISQELVVAFAMIAELAAILLILMVRPRTPIPANRDSGDVGTEP
jgi:predicted MFS family arabinose efflux permease